MEKTNKQGPQGPQKLSSLKSLKIRNPHRTFSLLQPSEMASLSNSRWKPIKNVQIDPQATNMWLIRLNVTS